MKRYFSLIELLIVISILLIIFSLLQPSLKNMLSLAHQTTCKNNLKGIGVAYALFPQDNDGWLCIGGNMVWAYELRNYLNFKFHENKRFYRNFVAKGTLLECPSTDFGDDKTPALFGGLAFNTFRMGAFETHSNKYLIRQHWSTVDKPEETIVIGDSMNFFPNNPRYHLLYAPSSIPWHEKAGYGSFVYTKHKEIGTNKLWVDGHVTFEEWEVLKLGKGNDVDYFYRKNK